MPRKKAEVPYPVDVIVGSRVRLRRDMLGMSQEKLGQAIGLTFQQVQKYESGANRIGASRLHQISQVLDVPVSFFYDTTDPVRAPPVQETVTDPESNPLTKRETVELVEAYYAIDNPVVRRRLFDLAKTLSDEKSKRGRRKK